MPGVEEAAGGLVVEAGGEVDGGAEVEQPQRRPARLLRHQDVGRLAVPARRPVRRSGSTLLRLAVLAVRVICPSLLRHQDVGRLAVPARRPGRRSGSVSDLQSLLSESSVRVCSGLQSLLSGSSVRVCSGLQSFLFESSVRVCSGLQSLLSESSVRVCSGLQSLLSESSV